ncbi:MAG TPA: response regulator [Herpetosiphonaceae bacterium]
MAQRILVIEDEAAIRAMLVDVLEEEGYAVVAAPGVDAGLALLPKVRPHLIICDLLLPPRTGRDVYDRLTQKAGGPPVPMLFITALPPADADTRLIGDLRHVPVLYKPLQMPELLTAVEMFIEQEN